MALGAQAATWGLELALVPGQRSGSDRAMEDPLCAPVQLGAAIAYTLDQLHPTALPLTRT